MPPNRYGEDGPDYERVIADMEIGKRRFRARNERIFQDARRYYLLPHTVKADGRPVNELAGDFVHTRTDAALMVDRIVGIVANKQWVVEIDQRADDDETVEATQRLEDWCRSLRTVWDNRWQFQGTLGNRQQPINRKEVGGYVLEGTCAFALDLDLDDEEDDYTPAYPLRYEPLNAQEVYPIGGDPRNPIVIRRFALTVQEARGRYPEIAEAHPAGEGQGGSDDETECWIVCWSDCRWHAIAWELGPSRGGWTDDSRRDRGAAGRDDGDPLGGARWIKLPRRHDLGFPVYLYPNPWGGSALPAMGDVTADHQRYVGQGVLTPLLKTFDLLDMLMSVVTTLAMQAANPAWALKKNPAIPGDRPKPDFGPGGYSELWQGDDLSPLAGNMAGTPDGQALIQSLLAEINNAAPAVLGGRGAAQSGFDRVLQGESAGVLAVDPIIDALERHYELVFRLSCELAYRKMVGKGKLFGSLEYRSAGNGQRARGEWGRVTRRDFELCRIDREAPGIRVTYDRLSQAERLQLANLMQGLVKEKLKSRFEAMRELGVADPAREIQRILQELAVEDPAVLKSLVGKAIRANGDPDLIEIWEAERLKENQPPPPPAGLPSPPGLPPPPGSSVAPPVIRGPSGQGPPPGLPSGPSPGV